MDLFFQDLFSSLVKFLTVNSSIEKFDFSLSCFAWNMIWYLNELDDQSEITREVRCKFGELLGDLSRYSARFQRQLTFMTLAVSSQTDDDSDDTMKTTSRAHELDECLASSDIRNSATFKFIMTHVSKLLEMSNRRGLSKSQLNCVIRLVVERLDDDQLDDEGRELVGKVFSLIGPVYDQNLYYESAREYLSVEEKCRQMVIDRFEESMTEETIFHRFYVKLFEKLFDSLNDEK